MSKFKLTEGDRGKFDQLPEEFIITGCDNLAVRQWLKDLGYEWNYGSDLTAYQIHHRNLASVKIWNEGRKALIVDNLKNGKHEFEGLPIITPKIELKIEVTGFDIEYPNQNQSKIDQLQQQIDSLQEQINQLKGETL